MTEPFVSPALSAKPPQFRLHFASGALGAGGAAGAAGALAGAGPWSRIERGACLWLLSTTRRMLVAKNAAARIAVVRVSKLRSSAPS